MRIRVVAVPLFVVGALQLAGCTSGSQVIPPGGTYLSTSAGANFDQSVTLADGEGNIASLPLYRAHRPTHAPQDVYVAAGNSGLVISHDGGQTWRIVSTPVAPVSDVVALANGVIVITGLDADGQGFVLRTIDEGKSWETVLTIPVPIKQQQNQLFGGNNTGQATVVISIAPDPFRADRIYAGTTLGNIFVGDNSAKTWQNIFTLTSGEVYSAPDQLKTAIADIVPSPHTNGELLVITGEGALYRINGQQQERLGVAVNLQKTTLYNVNLSQRVIRSVTFIPGFPNALFVGVDDGAVISRNRGETWEELPLPVDTATDFNTVVVTVSPTNSARMFVGINSVMYRSEDGGKTWHTFSLGLKTHAINSILIDPSNAANVLVVTSPLAS